MPAITSGVVVSALDANGVRTGNAHVAPCGFGIGGKQGKGCADPMGLALGSALLWGSLGATAPGHVLGNRSRTCCAGSFVSGLEQLRPPGIQTRTFRAPMFGPLETLPEKDGAHDYERLSGDDPRTSYPELYRIAERQIQHQRVQTHRDEMAKVIAATPVSPKSMKTGGNGGDEAEGATRQKRQGGATARRRPTPEGGVPIPY